MKIVQKFLCILLSAVLISFTPMAEYTNIQQIESVEASAAAIGAGTVLALTLLAAGVYVAPDASEDVLNDFTDWLKETEEEHMSSLEFLNSCDTNKYMTITPGFMVDVVDWLGTKFADLKSAAVSSVSLGGSNYKCPTDSSQALALKNALSSSDTTAAFCATNAKYLGYAYAFVNGTYPIYIIQQTFSDGTVKSQFYYLNGSSLYMQRVYRYYYVTTSLTTSSEKAGTYAPYSLSDRADTIGYGGNITFVNINYDSALSTTGLSLETVLNMADSVVGPSSLIENALTSFGDYVSDNIDKLAGLTFSASMATQLVDNLSDTIDANKVIDAAGSVTYADNIAQAVSDAYASGLADVIAQQDSIADKKEDEEQNAITSGWLSSIYDSVVALPDAIYSTFDSALTDTVNILSDVFQSTEDVKELITTIPSTLVGEFQEVFPTADTVTELVTGFPATIVDALIDVFPAAEDLREWISTVPSEIVNAVSAGVGTLADEVATGAAAITDALAAVKEAVLAVPNAVVGGLEALFVPDLTLAEAELNNFSSSFAFVGDLNRLVNDLMFKLEAGEPPTLYLDFTKAEDSKYHGAGKVLAIDFSWYAKYKATGDLVFGAFLWVLYMWYLFKRMPDIISGAGLITRDSINYDNRMNKKGGEKQ